MDCEFSVELGLDDPTLAVPWHSPDGTIEYVDLRENPSAIDDLSEVRDFPELGDFLRETNRGTFTTAKCDAWFDTLMDVDDEPYESALKCGSYVDVFLNDRKFALFEDHERQAREVVKRIRATGGHLRARAEIAVRRAYFEEQEGLYWTVYVFGYGKDAESARAMWAAALKLVGAAVTAA